MEFKVGDIVARKSYNYDVLFKIIKIHSDGVVDLVGITTRILADAESYDLRLISKQELDQRLKAVSTNRRTRMDRSYKNIKSRGVANSYRDITQNFNNLYQREKTYKKPGTVLHLDADKDYCIECKEIYKKMGIKANIFNIDEREQYRQVVNLLQRYKPEILVLTGHDAFIRRRNDMYNIDNYKNSRYYIQAVMEARRFEHNLDNLVIFAGACQSYYEAIISAGANFASAPKRVLIDMMDPMIVAQSVAYTPVNEMVSLENIIANTREGINGIGGLQTRGQYRVGIPGI